MREHRHFNKSDLIAVERPPIHATAIYDTNQAAAIIGIHPITIRRAMDAGEIARLELGRRILFRGQHLLDWLTRFEVLPKEKEQDSNNSLDGPIAP